MSANGAGKGDSPELVLDEAAHVARLVPELAVAGDDVELVVQARHAGCGPGPEAAW